MLRPITHASHGARRSDRRLSRRLSRRVRHPRHYLRFWVVTIAVAALVVLAGAVGWVAFRALALRPLAAALVSDAATFKREVSAGDAVAAAKTLTKLREESAQARDLTSGPAWALVAHLPVVGGDVAAARTLTSVAADLTEAARPFETALPALSGAKGARIDIAALKQVGAAMPAVSAAVVDGLERLDGAPTDTVVPQIGDGVGQVRSLLQTADGPVHTAGPSLEVLTTLLGGSGPRTYAVLLQQNAEARGTGGLVGSYAVLGADNGELKLKDVASRFRLDAGAKIPVAAAPQELQDLWGPDLQEWAGLNLSPHFPWTGQLVAAGWKAQGRPAIDGVVAVDQYSLAGLLAATGPITVRGSTVTPENAVQFLSKDIYAKYDYLTVDEVTAELVASVFQKVSSGQISPVTLVRALADPIRQHRVLVWMADPQTQSLIERTGLGGVLPDTPGPFAMAVVNNGGGNKLDAYLKTAVRYEPGPCSDGVRIGTMTVSLTSSAPKTGLPAYVEGSFVTSRGVLIPRGDGKNRILLDVYGPVGSTNAGVVVDGRDAEILAEGTDRNHSVWRVAVPLAPGETHTVEVGIVQPTTPEDAATAAVRTQPMVVPVTATVGRLTKCS